MFCQLVVSLYVDREPLYEISKPERCRIFNPKEKSNVRQNQLLAIEKFKSNNNFDVMQDVLISSLLEESLNIISATKTKIREQLKQKCETGNELRDMRIEVADFLNNELIQRVIFLVLKVSKFDVFKIVDKLDLYPRFICELFGLLEYDKSNPTLSYLLTTTRGNVQFLKLIF